MFGALAQLGERKVRNLEARGSIPLCSTRTFKGSGSNRNPFFLSRTLAKEDIPLQHIEQMVQFVERNNLKARFANHIQEDFVAYKICFDIKLSFMLES